ncbi:MAG TPA: hypothetical protein VIW24_22300 [Aldersonia sp.]
MMTTTLATPTSTGARPSVETDRQTFGRAVRSEWTKMSTLRSTWIGMAATILILTGFGVLAAAMSSDATEAAAGGPSFDMGTDPLATVLTGATLAMLLVGVLGCLAGAREYGSRMMTVTVAAVPRRWQIVGSKALVLAATVLPTTLLGVFGAYWAGMVVLSANGSATVGLSVSTLETLLGMAGYLTAVALIGLGLGVMLRSAAASIGVLAALLLVVPAVASGILPDSWDAVLRFLPSNAAASFTAITSTATDVLGSGAGVAVVIAWVAAALAAAVWTITRRDV